MLILLLACATETAPEAPTPTTKIHVLECTGDPETVIVRPDSVLIYQRSEPVNEGWDTVDTRLDLLRSVDGTKVEATCAVGAGGKILEVWADH